VLRIIAFPPADSHLWYSKVTQLAAQMGMPIGSTGRDIIAFVLQVAKAKNELEKVSQLIKSLAAATRIAERQAILSSMFASLAPKEPMAAPEGGMKSLEADSSTACKRDYDDVCFVSLHRLPIHCSLYRKPFARSPMTLSLTLSMSWSLPATRTMQKKTRIIH
jgi:hypothetical protein